MCLKSIIKCILGLVNGIILTVGLIFMAIGGILLWGMNSILPKLMTITNKIEDLLKDIGVTDTSATIRAVQNMIQANSGTIGAIFFAIGVVLVVIAVLIYVSLCCLGIKCIFIVLATIVSALLVCLIIILIVYGSGGKAKVFEHIEYGLRKLLKKYEGYKSTNPESILVNVVQAQLECCGIKDYTDYKDLTYTKINPTDEFPVSCCKSDNFVFVDQAKCLKKDEKYSNHKIGCYNKVKPSLDKYVGYVFLSIGISIGILAALDALLILFICCAEKAEK